MKSKKTKIILTKKEQRDYNYMFTERFIQWETFVEIMNKSSDKLQMKIVQDRPSYISHMMRPSEAVQFEAINCSQSYTIIDSINNPCKKIQLLKKIKNKI